ncbi:hypothetical protein CJ030_MR1G027859 [Morella rubra]|uniref:Uncharacterized protein n=1 Tax=Morella rubra TaxID=262757 RepID=A0A6A1WSU5_9ROSI|nr:hypothetical protein CJ030_MR1G027859 [Morella rubra]
MSEIFWSVKVRSSPHNVNVQTYLILGLRYTLTHAIVEELAGLGARVHTCSRNEAELNVCLSEWEKKGFQVTGSTCDVSLPAEREKLTSFTSSIFNGKLNILIKNAGTNIRKTTIDYTAEDFSFLMSTNLESVFHLCQLAYPLLKASGSGSIVFVSSVGGQLSVPASSIYGVTKGGMDQLARSLACEWAKDNIRSNSFVTAGGKFFNGVMSKTPLGRPGEPKEVASVVAFLCLPAASYGQRQCGFFEWVDNETCPRGKEILPGLFKKLWIREKELKSNKASKRAIIYLLLLSWVIIILLGLICLKLMAYPKNHLH